MSSSEEDPPETAPHFEEGAEAPPPGVRIMAIARWSLVVLMAFAAAASHWSTLRGGERVSAGPDARATYYCPMHPSVVQDRPGECPICGMSLVEREPTSAAPASRQPTATPEPAPERQAQPGGTPGSPPRSAQTSPMDLAELDLSPERVQLLGMRTARATHEALPSTLRTVGYVVPTEAGLASVQIRFSGWIQELHARETGQLVKRGQLLARIYSPELLAAQQELLNAKSWSTEPARGSERAGASAGALLGSARSRLALLGMDDAEIAEIERSGTPHRLVEVRSPAKGYIVQKNALEGLYIQPGTQLFQVADLSRVWVIAEIFERDASLVRVGQSAKLELAAYPSESFAGRVQFLYPSIDADTRTLRARVEFKNPELRLRPGMFGDVRVELPALSGLTIPREAVVDTGEHQYVFVAKTGGHFEPRKVQLGAREEDRVQIVSGLGEGDLVVTTGNFLLDSESRLRSALQDTAEPGK